MASPIWLYGDQADDLVLSVPNVDSGFPKENLVDRRIYRLCKINDTTDATIVMYLGDGSSAVEIQGAIIINLSPLVTDTVKLQGSDDGWTSVANETTLTIRTHPFSGIRYAYVIVNWENKQYRFLMNQALGSSITVGQVGLFVNKWTMAPGFKYGYRGGALHGYVEQPRSPLSGAVRRTKYYSKMLMQMQVNYSSQKTELNAIGGEEQVFFLPEGSGEHGYLGIVNVELPEHQIAGANALIDFEENA